MSRAARIRQRILDGRAAPPVRPQYPRDGKYYSQCGQDEILDNELFKGKKNGVVVEVGAFDGKWLSNSLYFEKSLGWKSVLIEPIPSVFQQLKVNRPSAICVQAAAYDREGTVQFNHVDGPSVELSGVQEDYCTQHKDRANFETQELGGTQKILTVPATKLSSVFAKHGIKHINYMSIDTEGSELKVIQGIDFSAVKIDVIGFEENYEGLSQPIHELLQQKGYTFWKKIAMDVFYTKFI